MDNMKAIVYTQYGPPEVLHIAEVAKPVPKDDEILIKTHASTVTAGDWRARSLILPRGFGFIARLMFGIRKPRNPILGAEISGEVEAVGKDVTKFKAGDQVFADSGAGMGCYVEYKCLPEDGAIAIKPANLTFDEAAAMSFGGTTALIFFRRGKLQPGETVLINGASGGVGTAAVQLARHFGAEVTGVCSAVNADLVRSLGADHVIDYTTTDFTKNGETYDVIMDTVGTAPYSRVKRSLNKKGRLLVVLGGLSDMLQVPWVSLTSSIKVSAGPAFGDAEHLQFLADLAAKGEFKPFIDRRYPVDQIVEAHRHVDTGRKRGNVVITWGSA